MDKLVTIDTIQAWFTEQIENKFPIDGHTFMDAANKINVLLQGEQETLFLLEQEVSLLKREYLEDGKTVAYAKVMIESSDKYREMRVQKAKIERCIELIRISKLNARVANDITRGQL